MTEIVTAVFDESDIVAAGHVLARAFHDDPLQVHVFPDAEERAQRSPVQMSALVRQGCLVGECFMTADMTGISVWMPPRSTTTPEHAAASGFHDLPGLMGREPFTRFGTVLDYLSGVHGNATPAECWYLMIVGVVPERQRRGHGRALLERVMARARAEGMPICLDTARADVRGFYEALGFRSVMETVDPGSGLRFWTYQRDP